MYKQVIDGSLTFQEVVIYMLLSDIETEDDHWQIEEVKGDMLKFVMKQAAITRYVCIKESS